VGDVDGNGKPDLLWQNSAGSVVVWFMGGTDGSVFLSGNLLAGDSATWRLVAAADMDGNGKADLIWQSTAGSVIVWYMGRFDGSVLSSGKLLAGDSATWRVAAIGDLDGNGKPDLIWQSDTGSVVVWYMGGVDGSTYQSGKMLAGDSASWKVVGL
jgi:hypothetical protein